jgi:Protein of unknown function (DUF5818)
MKKVTLLFAMFLAFAVIAFAQSDSQGSSSSSSSPSATQGSSPSQGSSTSTGSMGSPGSSSSTSTTGSQGSSSSQDTMGTHGSMSQGSAAKGEKQHKVKGCIRSEGGSYVLEDAHGRTYSLNSTEDLSAHVGHEVVIHGSEGPAAGSAVSGGSAGAGEKAITVSKVDMVSDTCKMGGKHGKGSSTAPPPSQK